MEVEILVTLGFTNAEAKIYLLLIELGPVKVGKLIERSRLQSSTVHNTIHSLIDKGFVTYVLKGKIKVYHAVDPRIVLKEFRERERTFEGIIPFLEQKKNLLQEKSEAEIYEGTSGIIALLNELIEDTKPKDAYYFFAVDQKNLNEDIQKFFERYDAKRKSKKLIVLGLARKELKSLFQHRAFLKMKYVAHPIPSNISICNNKMALIAWGEKPMGILIKSKPIIESQIKFFMALWETATS